MVLGAIDPRSEIAVNLTDGNLYSVYTKARNKSAAGQGTRPCTEACDMPLPTPMLLHVPHASLRQTPALINSLGRRHLAAPLSPGDPVLCVCMRTQEGLLHKQCDQTVTQLGSKGRPQQTAFVERRVGHEVDAPSTQQGHRQVETTTPCPHIDMRPSPSRRFSSVAASRLIADNNPAAPKKIPTAPCITATNLQ
jgi:hypothetical protein